MDLMELMEQMGRTAQTALGLGASDEVLKMVAMEVAEATVVVLVDHVFRMKKAGLILEEKQKNFIYWTFLR